LYPDQTNHSAAGSANSLRQRAHVYDGVPLVEGFDLDVHLGAEDAFARAFSH
jgi:hypothetical protein